MAGEYGAPEVGDLCVLNVLNVIQHFSKVTMDASRVMNNEVDMN